MRQEQAGRQKKWTSSELKTLLSNSGTLPQIPGRSAESIRQKMIRLGLKVPPKRQLWCWSEKEINILRDASEKGLVPTINGRSKGSILNKMRELGFRKPGRFGEWNTQEIEILKFSKIEGGILPVVPGKSQDAVRSKMKSMGLILPKNKAWSKAEIDELKYLHESGRELVIEGRTPAAVIKKVNDLKLKTSHWSAEEIEALKNNGHVPGKSKNAIQSMKGRLGLTNKHKPRLAWPKEREERLKELHATGLSARKIDELGEFPGQTKMSIQKKLCRMGLAKKIGRKFPKLPYDANLRLKKFLQDNWAGKTSEELAEMWTRINFRYPVGDKKVSALLKELGIKISCYEAQKIKSIKKRESQIMTLKNLHSTTISEKIRAERIRLMRSRFEKRRDIWTGLESEEIEENEPLEQATA